MTEFNNIKLIKRGDIAYPTQLEEVYQPPETLYCLGNVNLLYKRMVAVVGSRKCSEYGKKMAMKLGEVLSRADISVVSGMAKGIDSFGHIGALKQEGGTVAVLGCGVDVCYPA